MKHILIIGAGFLQSFLIKKAKELGCYVIAFDKNPSSYGFQFADKHEAIDIVDYMSCYNVAKKLNIDGVITAATDYGVYTASYIANRLNLPGLDPEIAKTVKNKFLVRDILCKHQVDDISQFFLVDDMKIINSIKKKLRYPVIVKPCDGSGSRGISKVEKREELEGAFKLAINSSLSKCALIEDFVCGLEFGAETYVFDDNPYVLGVIKKKMTKPPVYAELGHTMPFTSDFNERICLVAKKAIKALGINHGAVNMDLILTNDRKICIVDIGARMGGNLIGSHLVPTSTGIDYMKLLIKQSLGESNPIRKEFESQNICTRILALKPGLVEYLPDLKKIEMDCNVQINHHLKVGDIIESYQNNLDGKGYIVSVGNDVVSVERNADEALNLFDEGIVRKNV